MWRILNSCVNFLTWISNIFFSFILFDKYILKKQYKINAEITHFIEQLGLQLFETSLELFVQHDRLSRISENLWPF